MYGCTGKILRVNLDKEEVTVEAIDNTLQEKFVGGRGIAVKIYEKEVASSCSPADPENKIIISSGALTGTGAISGAIGYVVSKSPLTGAITCGRIRGHFPAEMKFSGFDVIIIEGKYEHPAILSVNEGRASLKPALQFWGRTTSQTENLLKKELKDDWAARETYILSIGPAGETLADISTMVAEGNIVSGGAGLGAVMGSKNLKAIAVKGNQSLTVSDGDKFTQAITNFINRLSSQGYTSRELPDLGTPFMISVLHERGLLPGNNFRKNILEYINRIDDKALHGEIPVQRVGCFSCPIRCKRFTRVITDDSSSKGLGPDFEAIAAFGAGCEIKDIVKIARLSHFCSDYGLDSTCLGAALSCLKELYEKEKVSKEDIGLDISSWDEEGVLRLVQLAGNGKGFGKVLGQGAHALAEQFQYPEAFIGAKKLAMPGLDPRGIQGLGLHFATSNCGAYHLDGFTVIEEIFNLNEQLEPGAVDGKPALVKRYQDMTAALDCLGVCIYSLLGLKINNLVPLVNNGLGLSLNLDELMKIGERVWNLERVINLKSGFTGKDDTLSQRLLSEKISEGKHEGEVCQLVEMLPEYYRIRGWGESGIPTPEKLTDLELS